MDETPHPVRPHGAATIAALLLAMLAPLAAAVSALVAPAGSGPVAALFPPWWSERDSVEAAAAAGPVIRLGGVGFIVIVAQPDRRRLRQAGAWLLLDPIVAGLCSPSVPQTVTRTAT